MNDDQRLPEEEAAGETWGSLDDLVRRGAQRMLRKALEEEVNAFVGLHANLTDAKGRRVVVRNGHLPKRTVMTGAGPMEVEQPRVRDRRGAGHEDSVVFSSKLLPRYLRRSKAMDELLPWLYLRGISTGDFQQALEALVGPDAVGLSAATITRLVGAWSEEHEAWGRRQIEGEYVYIWVDGIFFNVRLEDDRQCILVIMGAREDGTKELLGVIDGYRESEQSWWELLTDLRARGLQAPKLAVGDGALGFWAALRKVFPETREQRCWVHKTANVLNKMPRSVQAKAKADLHEIWMAETKANADLAFDTFLEKYGVKYPKATACLVKDRESLLTFYEFPAEHWLHLRTTNPIESTFATIRLRHRRTKGSGSRRACLAMVFKLAKCAEKTWRKLNGRGQLLKLLQGCTFVDGILEERNAA